MNNFKKIDLSIPVDDGEMGNEVGSYLEQKCIDIISRLAEVCKAKTKLTFDYFTFDEIIHEANVKCIYIIMVLIHETRVMYCKAEKGPPQYLCPRFETLNVRYTQKMIMKAGVNHILKSFDTLEQFKIFTIDPDAKWLDLTLASSDKAKLVKTIRTPIVFPNHIWINFSEKPIPYISSSLEITTNYDCEILVTGILFLNDNRNEEFLKASLNLDLKEYGFRLYNSL